MKYLEEEVNLMQSSKKVRGSNSRRRVKKSAVAILLAIVLCVSFIVYKGIGLISQSFAPFEVSSVEQSYTSETYADLSANVRYTNDKKLNKVIDQNIAKILDENSNLFLDKGKSLDIIPSYAKEYDLLSYVLADQEGNLNNVYGSFIINLKNHDIILPSDLLGEDLKGLSMILRNELKKDENLKYNKNMYLNTLPEIKTFEHMIFDDAGMTLYFEKDSFETDTYKKATISYFDLLDYLNEISVSVFSKDYVQKDVSHIRYIDPLKPMISFTFDDGPVAANTLDLAQYFESKGQRVTYFMLGSRIAGNEDLIKQLHDMGHEIGNHSYDHPNYNTLTDEQLIVQTEDVSNVIRSITNQKQVLIRPPYGAANEAVRSKISSPLIFWSVDPEDWKYRDVDLVYANIDAGATNGGIILMHDLYGTTKDAAKRFLDKYENEYQFVTVTELHEYSGAPLVNGQFTSGVNR